MRIEPTVGRIVWFTPKASDPFSKDTGGQPLAGQVAHVNEDGTVNLMVVSATGSPEARERVVLVQDGTDKPDDSYASWMPYQTGQAAKTEAALAAKTVSAAQATEAEAEELARNPVQPVVEKAKTKKKVTSKKK